MRCNPKEALAWLLYGSACLALMFLPGCTAMAGFVDRPLAPGGGEQPGDVVVQADQDGTTVAITGEHGVSAEIQGPPPPPSEVAFEETVEGGQGSVTVSGSVSTDTGEPKTYGDLLAKAGGTAALLLGGPLAGAVAESLLGGLIGSRRRREDEE